MKKNQASTADVAGAALLYRQAPRDGIVTFEVALTPAELSLVLLGLDIVDSQYGDVNKNITEDCLSIYHKVYKDVKRMNEALNSDE